MWLEQAVFTSTKSRQGEGYHVVAKSPGVSSDITTALNRRCPSHGALQGNASDFESLNFHRLTPNTLAVSRTVYGGKEYSNRGGLQVVTIVLVVKDFQLEGYVNDPFCLARMARSLGHLRWQPQFPSTLPSIELPDMELTGRWTPSGDCYENSDKALQHWYGGGSVAVVSEERAEEIIGSLLRRLPVEQRCSFHFTTGLKWSKQRAFRMYVLRNLDSMTRLLMNGANVFVLDAKPIRVGMPAVRV